MPKSYKSDLPVVVMIPDTQVKPGVPVEHLEWAGKYIADKFSGHPDCTVVHIGDHWDFPSLSSYDKGKKAMEGRRYRDDVDAGNDAFRLLDRPISRTKGWKVRKIFLDGNHCARASRAAEDNAQMDGTIDLWADTDVQGWERHPFLEVVEVHGVHFSHYFYNPLTGRPYAGLIDTQLKNIGRSFAMGHRQVYQTANRPVGPKMHRGLVAGSFYAHDEQYLGPQGNDNWRGMIVMNEVRDGDYGLLEVSLDYLARRYGDYKGLLDYQRAYGIRP